MTTDLPNQNLAHIGLNNREQQVYLALLELGSGSVQTIAKKARLERTGVYGIVSQLIHLGLVSETRIGKKRTFIAENPQRLLGLMDRRRTAVADMLPGLQSLWTATTIRPVSKFYEGIEGMRTVLTDIYTSDVPILYGILSMKDLDQTVGVRWMDHMIKHRVRANRKLHVVRSRPHDVDRLRWPSDEKSLRTLRYAPPGMMFTMTNYIYGTKVAFLASERENFGMIIESDEFATNQLHLFDALWQVSQPDQ